MSFKSFWAVALVVGLSLLGCGGASGPALYPVEGIVEIEGGGTATQGEVVLTSSKNTATGVIGTDGKFKLGTNNPGDGVPVGDYRATVMGTSTGDYTARVRLIDEKYESEGSSGLKFSVAAKPNEYKLMLTKPAAN